jgi:DUF2933 family protein
MNDQNTHAPQDKKNNLVLWVFISFIAYLLITEHWAHIVPYLPYLILLLCPLMHFFMHGGHGHGGHEHGSHEEHDSHENLSHHEEK